MSIPSLLQAEFPLTSFATKMVLSHNTLLCAYRQSYSKNNKQGKVGICGPFEGIEARDNNFKQCFLRLSFWELFFDFLPELEFRLPPSVYVENCTSVCLEGGGKDHSFSHTFKLKVKPRKRWTQNQFPHIVTLMSKIKSGIKISLSYMNLAPI